MKLLDAVRSRRLYFDGACGTMLQARGLRPGEPPETFNLTHPEIVRELHRAYLDAGADLIKANTFGLNRLHFEDPEPVARAAVQAACAAVASAGREAFVLYDIGPLGRLLRPLGDLAFEDAVALFADGARFAERYGADGVLIETMTDTLETKAALLAVRENCSLPVFVSNAYGADGKLTTGGDPAATVALLEGLGADAIGINCSLGPEAMLPILRAYAAHSSLPLLVNPNAGLPAVRDGKTVYDCDPETFSDAMAALAAAGATLLGGCCGTTPDHIRRTVEKTRGLPFALPTEKTETVVSSYTHAVVFGGDPILIGERINPTGKKKIKEALRAGAYESILAEGVRQAEAGVQLLDVNAGLPEIDEPAAVTRLVTELQAVTDLPLQIDTTNPEALGRAMRVYNGKPLVNSVSGSAASMAAVFPLVRKYGGAVIVLTMDEQGIPATAEGRVAIAARVAEEAARYGIRRCELIVDPLTLTVSAEPTSPTVTLEAVRRLHTLGLRTSLGVSNVSFGLPDRDAVNAAFFALALGSGLDAAIMNPFSARMMQTYHAFRALRGFDAGCREYIATATAAAAAAGNDAVAMSLREAIVRGLTDSARGAAEALLPDVPPLTVIEREIVPALSEIGERFEQKTAYLPQLLMSAEAASAAFEALRRVLPPGEGNGRRIVLATVRGDIHDIGKNIVRVLLENFGFAVTDLGRDVEPQRVVDAVREAGEACRLVGLSALMTTTVPAMEETIRRLRKDCPDVRVVVGGAVLTQDYADRIGADCYAADAMATVRYAQRLFACEREP